VLICTLVVVNPTVSVTADPTPTVGLPTTLVCSGTTVRGINTTVDIMWSRDDQIIQSAENVTVNLTSDNMLAFSDSYITGVLNESANGTMYECKVRLANTSVMVPMNYTLDLTCKYISKIELLNYSPS